MRKDRTPAPAHPDASPQSVATYVYRLYPDQTTVIRHWKPGDAERCTRCTKCNRWRRDGAKPDDVTVCQVWVPPAEVFDVCFGESRVTRPDPPDTSNKYVKCGPVARRRPRTWQRDFEFDLHNRTSATVYVCVTTRARWRELTAEDETYASHCMVTNLWGGLVIALKLKLKPTARASQPE